MKALTDVVDCQAIDENIYILIFTACGGDVFQFRTDEYSTIR